MKIGITGNKGFIGRHLTNWLRTKPNMEIVPFENGYFEQEGLMDTFVSTCDTIVHLAAVNRHPNPEILHDTNIALIRQLVAACTRTGAKPHVLFSSSTQELLDNHYGQSKKQGREVLGQWSEDSGSLVCSMVIPNVFGPFGKPFYNSVVATFCHLFATGQNPEIQQDSLLNLIYVNELVEDIWQIIEQKTTGRIDILPRHQCSVIDLYHILKSFKDNYLEQGYFPDLTQPLHLALFNTFRCYIPDTHYPVAFIKHTDARGAFVEIARANTPGQSSYSTTRPGITRGNHYHTRKAERFAVIQGKAKISIRKIDSDQVADYFLDGDTPAFVDMPIWHTHNITNIGETELVTLFWINEPYNPENPDTYFQDV